MLKLKFKLYILKRKHYVTSDKKSFAETACWRDYIIWQMKFQVVDGVIVIYACIIHNFPCEWVISNYPKVLQRVDQLLGGDYETNRSPQQQVQE
jgi:hypothetical protein